MRLNRLVPEVNIERNHFNFSTVNSISVIYIPVSMNCELPKCKCWVHLVLGCNEKTKELVNWWVSNIFTRISHFRYWIVVKSSSLICFNEFRKVYRWFENKHRNRDEEAWKTELLEGRRNKKDHQCRSRAGRSPTPGRSTVESQENWRKSRAVASRSPRTH